MGGKFRKRSKSRLPEIQDLWRKLERSPWTSECERGEKVYCERLDVPDGVYSCSLDREELCRVSEEGSYVI